MSRDHESMTGVVTGETAIAPADWKFCGGGTFDEPQPLTALPVQIYTWVTRSDPAFVERSNAAIIVLLAFLVVMNLLAILLRRKFERRW